MSECHLKVTYALGAGKSAALLHTSHPGILGGRWRQASLPFEIEIERCGNGHPDLHMGLPEDEGMRGICVWEGTMYYVTDEEVDRGDDPSYEGAWKCCATVYSIMMWLQ